ncbi:MAG: hypothetical protein M3Y81_28135, partial [Chloroflexota bacterium]|nr:hypothetical protein [Chloroflexota bacterium]
DNASGSGPPPILSGLCLRAQCQGCGFDAPAGPVALGTIAKFVNYQRKLSVSDKRNSEVNLWKRAYTR